MHGIGRALASLLKDLVRSIVDSYRLGIRTLGAAPVIVAVAAIPEFVQHGVEIELGMFDSRAAAAGIANGAIRWGFGYAKIAGLVLAMLLTARFWARGSLRDTVRIAPLQLLKIVAIAAALVLVGGRISELGEWLAPAAAPAFTILSLIFQFGMLVWLIGTLVEDPASSLRHVFAARLPTAALLLLLCATAFAPGQALHGLDHRLALGQPRPLVWALMAFDSLVVGLMAVILGAALYTGYLSGASWRGWTPPDLNKGQPGRRGARAAAIRNDERF